jgi:hypothetical protein
MTAMGAALSRKAWPACSMTTSLCLCSASMQLRMSGLLCVYTLLPQQIYDSNIPCVCTPAARAVLQLKACVQRPPWPSGKGQLKTVARFCCPADCVAALLPDVCPARRLHLHCEGLVHLRNVEGRGASSSTSSAELPPGSGMSTSFCPWLAAARCTCWLITSS